MALKPKTRTLYYRRAQWLDMKPLPNLEACVAAAYAARDTTKLRTFGYQEGEIQGLDFHKTSSKGTLFHVANYVPHQPWTIVPVPSDSERQSTGTQAPPARNNFLEGDVFFLISGNEILICPSGAREAVVELYLKRLLQIVGEDEKASCLNIAAVADVNKINMIRNQGVKKVELNSSLYEATNQYEERRNVRETLMGDMAESFLSLFANDPNHNLRGISEKENLTVKLIISFDQRKSGEIGQERLASAAENLLESNEPDGFTIITGDNQRLSASEIRISEKVSLEARGNTVAKRDAWDCLTNFFTKLNDSGIMQQ